MRWRLTAAAAAALARDEANVDVMG
jgi:hypothetical protein